MSGNVCIAEYVSYEDKNSAHYFINMLLKSLPVKKDEKNVIIDGVNVVLTYNKTSLKREADMKILYEGKLYSTKFLHSDLHHYSDLITNWLTAYVINHKTDLENLANQD